MGKFFITLRTDWVWSLVRIWSEIYTFLNRSLLSSFLISKVSCINLRFSDLDCWLFVFEIISDGEASSKYRFRTVFPTWKSRKSHIKVGKISYCWNELRCFAMKSSIMVVSNFSSTFPFGTTCTQLRSFEVNIFCKQSWVAMKQNWIFVGSFQWYYWRLVNKLLGLWRNLYFISAIFNSCITHCDAVCHSMTEAVRKYTFSSIRALFEVKWVHPRYIQPKTRFQISSESLRAIDYDRYSKDEDIFHVTKYESW